MHTRIRIGEVEIESEQEFSEVINAILFLLNRDEVKTKIKECKYKVSYIE